MSVPPKRRLPDRPSLEQLRKQAKEHLDTQRAADPSVSLAAAQHALAREYGFGTWPKLVRHVESIQPERRMLQPTELKSDQNYLGAGTPLSNAAAAGRMDIVQLLLDHGADPNLPEEQFAPKGKALYSAVYHGHYEIAKLLLERGAFPNPPVESSGDALWVAREWRPDRRMEQLLLSYRATPHREHWQEDWPTRTHNWLRISPLHQAARKGDLAEAKKLIESGADLTARDEHLRSTPLAWAAKYGQLEMVKFLLRRGASKSLPDDPPWATPLAWAVRRKHDEIARLLS